MHPFRKHYGGGSMNYSEVINKAWKYMWKHKALWLFALFAGSLVGVSFGMPGSNPGGRMQYRFGNEDWPTHMPPFFRDRMPQLWQDMRSANPWMWVWVILAMVVVALLITAISLFFSTAGRGGLIKGLLLAEDKFDDKPIRFKEAWQGIKPYFWRLLLLRLFVGAALAILSAILVVLFIVITIMTLGLALCLLIPMVLLAIPIGWLVKAVVANASIALVDEDLGVFKSIARSWQIVSANVWSVLLVMLFNALLTFGTVLAVLFPFVLVSAPFFLTGLFGGELSTTMWIVLGVLLFLAFVLALFIGMWANTLIHGIFVIAYRRFKYLGNAPLGKTEFIAPVSPEVSAEVSTPLQVDLPTEIIPEDAAGSEPASKDSDEASQQG